jgi:ABC-2 type transport system ATP-binding protein
MTDPGTALTVVRARGLTKTYGNVTAVDGVDLTVGPGDVYGLLGPNGAGKSTFMRMLFGLVRPDQGEISVWGTPVQPDPTAALQHVAGFVETPRFYPYLSGRSNLALLARLDRLDRDVGAHRIAEALEAVDLTDRAGDKVRGYSYGMVQRLGVAATLMRAPRLLVLDEPTNGLDPAGIRDMRALIHRLVDSGLTLLLSSHHMEEVNDVCTRVAIMRSGRLAFDGSTEELRARADRATRHLVTSDNPTALAICRGRSELTAVQSYDGRIVFDADDRTVERLSRDLVAAGVAIRSLHAPTTALETLFFRLTEPTPGTTAEAAA